MTNDPSVKIYCMTHINFTPPKDRLYIPLCVGKAFRPEIEFSGDDTGDNISHLNPYYAELSGIYWVWKNVHDADYVGICHYRRYLIDDKENLLNKNQILKLLENNDVITTMLLELRSDYYTGFGCNHNIKDLDAATCVIKEMYPDYFKTYNDAIRSNRTYFGNMLICRKSLFDDYCKWLFSILFEVQKRVNADLYDNYQKRIFGFISEILLYVYLKHNNLKVACCKVGLIGEKKETALMKQQLCEYFKACDYEKAHSYFNECLKKRPDVLMEASDVFGELKLCMQIISTCEFEAAAGHPVILTRTNDFTQLLELFRTVNKIAERKLSGKATTEDLQFLSDNNVSREMLDIALLLAKSADTISSICYE